MGRGFVSVDGSLGPFNNFEWRSRTPTGSEDTCTPVLLCLSQWCRKEDGLRTVLKGSKVVVDGDWG